MSAPLRAGASTTTVASASPLMIRLRRGKVPTLGLDVRRQLGDDRAAGRDDGRRQPAVGARMEDRVARPDDRDGRAPGMDRGCVRGAIDAHGEPRHHAGAGRSTRFSGESRRDRPAVIGRPTRPDDRHRPRRIEGRRIAEHVQDVRRHLDGGEPRRIRRIVDRDHAQTELADPSEGPLCELSGLGDRERDRERQDARPLPPRRARPRTRRRAGPGRPATKPRAGSRRHCRSDGGGCRSPTGPEPVDAGQDRPGVALGPGIRRDPDSTVCRVGAVGHGPRDQARRRPARSPRRRARQRASAAASRMSAGRYHAASARCSSRTRSSPARSAIVRATRRIRSVPRPLARSSSASPTMARSDAAIESTGGAQRPSRESSVEDARRPGRRHGAPCRDPRSDDRRALRLRPARGAAAGATRGIAIQRSIRSRNGPEIRR